MQTAWRTVRGMKGRGVDYPPGAVVPGVEQWDTFRALRNTHAIELATLDDGAVRPATYKAERPLNLRGVRYLPGDVVPNAATLPNFAYLRRKEWLVPATTEDLVVQAVEIPVPAAPDAAPAPRPAPHHSNRRGRRRGRR